MCLLLTTHVLTEELGNHNEFLSFLVQNVFEFFLAKLRASSLLSLLNFSLFRLSIRLLNYSIIYPKYKIIWINEKSEECLIEQKVFKVRSGPGFLSHKTHLNKRIQNLDAISKIPCSVF